MAATIKLYEQELKIDDYEWSGEDESLVTLLNSMLDPFGPSGADPNPDLTEATRIVDMFGGKVVSFDETEYDEDAIY